MPSAKFVDGPKGTTTLALTPSLAPQWTTLNFIQEGTSKFTRIGDRIRMKSIQLFAKWIPATANQNNEQPVYGRIAIVYDRRPSGAAPTFTDVFNTYDEAGGQFPNTWSPPNPNQTDRFLIVRDCKYYFATNNPNTNNNMATFMMNNTYIEGSECNLYRRLNGLETQYLGSANPMILALIGTGALYLLVIGSNSIASTGPGQFEFSWRLRYYDY